MTFSTLDTTVGGVNANSYGTVEELRSYFANRSEASAFLAMSDETIIARMIQATIINDTVLYPNGILANTEQALAFPRKKLRDKHGRTYAEDTIPRQVKYAQFEQALYCFNNSVTLPSILTQGFSEVKLDVMSLKLNKEFVPKKMSEDAIDFLSLFGEVTSQNGDMYHVNIVRY